MKEHELADIASKGPSLEAVVDEKERDVQKVLLECTSLEWLLGLVINREGCLNPHLVRGIRERFVLTTHVRTLFYQ